MHILNYIFTTQFLKVHIYAEKI